MRTRGQGKPEQLVRARSFELVNEAGQAIAEWGSDNGKNAGLAFGSRGLKQGSTLAGRPAEDLKNPHSQEEAIGLQGNDMDLSLYGNRSF